MNSSHQLPDLPRVGVATHILAPALCLLAISLSTLGCSTNSKPPRDKTREQPATATKQAVATTPQSGTYESAPTREAASVTDGRTTSSAGLTYTVPASWSAAAPSSGMRAAQFALPAAQGEASELVLFFFGAGQGGDVQANLDRWVGQMHQPDGGDARSRAQVSTRTVGPYRVTLLAVDGTYTPGAMMGGAPPAPKNDQRMWCAVVEGPGGPWFWKATGSKPAMEAEAAHFDALASSFRPAP